MAAFLYTPAKVKLWKALIDLDGHDIRVMLVMTNTTADTEKDAENPADLTTLDEFDGAGYARQALGSEAVNQDDVNDRAEFDAGDTTFATLSNGTRQIQGYIIYRHVDGNPANDELIAYRDFAAVINPGGSDLLVQWNAEGIMQHTD